MGSSINTTHIPTPPLSFYNTFNFKIFISQIYTSVHRGFSYFNSIQSLQVGDFGANL
jgi:hypothetical protein